MGVEVNGAWGGLFPATRATPGDECDDECRSCFGGEPPSPYRDQREFCMRARIHRGAAEVGGNCVELEAGGERLVLDVGW